MYKTDELSSLEASLQETLQLIARSTVLSSEKELQDAVRNGTVTDVIEELKNVQASVPYYAPLGTDQASRRRVLAEHHQKAIMSKIVSLGN